MLADPEVEHESAAHGRWWETKLGGVDWSLPAALQLRRRRYWRKHSPIQPPHYHDLLLRPSFPSRGRYGAIATKTTPAAGPGLATPSVSSVDHGNHSSPGAGEAEKERWNDGLIGVRMAEDALEQFETDVGFHYSTMPDVVLQEFLAPQLDVGSEVSDEDLDAMRDIWLQRLHDLVGEYIVPERPVLKLDGDFRPRSSLSSSEYDSEHSVESEPFPCTPTHKHNVEVRVQQSPPATGPKELPQPVTVSARSPTPTSASPVRTVKQSTGRSRSASSLPSGSPSSSSSTSSRSPSPPDFVFPAINANYQHLPPNLRKDDQGFYTPVTPPGSPHRIRKEHALGPSGLSKSTSPSSLLPPFLGENQSRTSRKASKTREIVDQLRSGGGEKKKSHTRARAPSGSATKDTASHRSSSGGSSSNGVESSASVELPTITSPPKERTASSTGRRGSSASSSNVYSSTPRQRSSQGSAGSAGNSGATATSSSSSTSPVSPDSAWTTPSPSASISSHPNPHTGSSQPHKRFPSIPTAHIPSHSPNALQPPPPHQPHLLTPPGVSLSAGPGPGPNPFFAHPPRLSRPGPGQAPTAPPLLPVGYAASAPHMPPGMSPQQLHTQMHMPPQMHQVQVPPQMQAGHGRGAGHWMPVMSMGHVGMGGGAYPHLGAQHITGSSGMQHVAW